MGDRVGGPEVGGVALYRLAPGRLGGGIVAALLQGEGLQPQHEAVARHGLVPGVKRPRDGTAHALGGTQIEVQVLRQLQRHDVVRMVQQQDVVGRRRRGQVLLGEQQQEAALQIVCQRHRRVQGQGFLQAVPGRQFEAQVGVHRGVIGLQRRSRHVADETRH